ncbi:MAG: hypothetical protein QXR58_02730 [Candidatus Micrarchaeaceae archaeon]
MQKNIPKSNRKIGKKYRKQKASRLKRQHRKVFRLQKAKLLR